ncbi:MAG: DNA polymerase domain-containing protein [Leptospirales bacterium]
MPSNIPLLPEKEGWLLDAYPAPDGMVLWMVTKEEERIMLLDPFRPSLYISGTEPDLRRTLTLLEHLRIPFSSKRTEKTELFSGSLLPVLEIKVHSPLQFSQVVRHLTRVGESIALYNCDIPLPQLYFYERSLFPLAFCSFSTDPEERVHHIRAIDSPWDTDYCLPPLRQIDLKFEGISGNPAHGARGQLEIVFEGKVRTLEGEDPRSLLSTLNRYLQEEDPDLILTDWGDSQIFPQLLSLSEKFKIPLSLNRSPGKPLRGQKGRSYFSYGQTRFRADSWILSGRWHLDRKNSFILPEAGLEGLFEQSRVTKLPLQSLARSSTGTGITSMQLDMAYQKGILIPWRKSEPESFKTGIELLSADKGGMVFLPPEGFHESVAELDFASMYPTIMTTFNISPETVGCSCCPGNLAPETEHTVCTRRKGLVPSVLDPILFKRQRYKDSLKTSLDLPSRKRYDQRQKALKWLLVVSFGYLGYKNARFGRIEAHECVTAYSREKLLQAKEVAEGRGYRLLHGIVDSIWIQKSGLTETDCQSLADEISRVTGLPINLEGVYRWIGFFPSRSRPGLSVPNRFFGVFQSGEIKVRGLETRRSDTPPFVQEVQRSLLLLFSQAKDLQEYETRIPEALSILEEALERLKDGRVPIRELVISRKLTRDPLKYGRATLQAVVAQELAARGVTVHPGETIQYIITNARDQDPASRARAYSTFSPDHTYDREKYAELLLQAAEPLLLSPFGDAGRSFPTPSD